MSDKEIKEIGWNAIDRELLKIYGEQEPIHYGTMIPYMLGGNDPLDGISIYLNNNEVPHWHYVTYGFSELFENESENKDISGYGFELTFRLKKEDEDTPPKWPVVLLQNMGRYVFETGNTFDIGDYLDANGPILLDSKTLLKALLFTEDIELGTIETENGKVKFIQAIGATIDELDGAKCWSTNEIVKLLKKFTPMGLTDLNRKSILESDEAKEKLEEGILRDGSNTGILFFSYLGWSKKKNIFSKNLFEVHLSAKDIITIGRILKGRILKNKDLYLMGDKQSIKFIPGEKLSFNIKNDFLEISINEDFVYKFCDIVKPMKGKYNIQDLKINVEKSIIKDRYGNVVDIIG